MCDLMLKEFYIDLRFVNDSFLKFTRDRKFPDWNIGLQRYLDGHGKIVLNVLV